MSSATQPVVRRGPLTARPVISTVLSGLAAAVFLLSSLALPATWSPQARAAADSCAAVEVVFARGTNEAPGVGATGEAFVDALNARLPGTSVNVYGVNYPASMNFGQAVDGVADASNTIQSIVASCPSTEIVLGGYSQGAAVAGYTTTDAIPAGFDLPAGITGPMPPAVASHVAAVVLFGTPIPGSWACSTAAPRRSPSAKTTSARLSSCARPATRCVSRRA